MRFAIRDGLLRVVLPALAVLGVAASSASASPTAVVGHVYVNDDTALPNTIAAFDRHADGTLTPEPGSPFAAGGAGTGTGIASQGSLQESADGRYLIAVDGGSNQLSVMRILRGGGIAPVPGGVTWSGGLDPVSVAIHRSLVYVANAGDGGSNYTGFRLGGDGRLHAIPGATFPLPDGAQPGDVLFNGSGKALVGARVGTSEIDSFRVHRDGRLVPAPGSPFTAEGPGPFGSEFRPTDPSQLFVSNAHGGANAGTVSAFNADHDGTLSSIGGSPFADQQTAPCWVEISHDGEFLFTVNTASASISSYHITRDGSLALLGSTPMRDPTGLGPEDARLSPDGSTLWVVDSGRDAVSGFSVNGGSLAELASSPTALPAGATPAGIVVN
jgi:6-phosphogluconolactonase (cycloisomerase 2 family)